MNIVMMTNTYLPHVGGVAQSVDRFSRAFRALGHRVLIVAPEFEGQPEHEVDVVRVPALQKFNGSDFAVTLPVFGSLRPALDAFEPDIIHSHHPFLIGVTAIRVAASRQLPLVFTHHTMYEQYVHYVPIDAPRVKEFTIKMVTSYANQSDLVIAPSASVANVLRARGIESPISVVPTGVNVRHFRRGDGRSFRRRFNIPRNAFVVGHVGRLAPEKNLQFLARAAARCCAIHPETVVLIVGAGPSEQEIEREFQRQGVRARLIMAGVQRGRDLVDSYHAMDVFAFSSFSETQGMVLVEAMAAGVPVVALDAPGAREVVQDRRNGRLLANVEPEAFAQALAWVAELPSESRDKLKTGARMTGDVFSTENCARQALSVYESVLDRHKAYTDFDEGAWGVMLNTLREEWTLWSDRIAIATDVLFRDLAQTAAEEPDAGRVAPLRLACPHCSRVLNVSARHIGSVGTCNHCGGRMVVGENALVPIADPRARSKPDAETFPHDFDTATLWFWVDKELQRGVPLQDLLDYLYERQREMKPGTEMREWLAGLRAQFREGMLYRNWKGASFEREERIDEAIGLYEENVADRFTGWTPYQRLRILYSRRRDYDNALRVCAAFLDVARDPVKRALMQRHLESIQHKQHARRRSVSLP
jgi:glycosyltransferase involved in cell wall biosynthesis